jgi:protein TonB
MSDGVQAPKRLHKVEPDYTEEAKAAGIDGTVRLSVVVGVDGQARAITVVRGLDAGLDLKAIEAAEKWHFQAGTKDGQAVPVRAQIEINFRLK